MGGCRSSESAASQRQAAAQGPIMKPSSLRATQQGPTDTRFMADPLVCERRVRPRSGFPKVLPSAGNHKCTTALLLVKANCA